MYGFLDARENFPDLTNHDNVLSKCLTEDIYESLFDEKTSTGYTIDKAIQVGVDCESEPIGLYLGDEDSIELFEPLLSKILTTCQPNFDYNNKKVSHTSDLAVLKKFDGLATIKNTVSNYTFILRRTLKGYNLPTHCTRAERREVNVRLVDVLKNLPLQDLNVLLNDENHVPGQNTIKNTNKNDTKKETTTKDNSSKDSKTDTKKKRDSKKDTKKSDKKPEKKTEKKDSKKSTTKKTTKDNKNKNSKTTKDSKSNKSKKITSPKKRKPDKNEKSNVSIKIQIKSPTTEEKEEKKNEEEVKENENNNNKTRNSITDNVVLELSEIDDGTLSELEEVGLAPDRELSLLDTYLVSGLSRDFPDARSLFYNKIHNIGCWTNHENHLEMAIHYNNNDLSIAYKKFLIIYHKLRQNMRKRDLIFLRHKRLGWITTSPAHFGTGLTIAVDVRIPNLASHNKFENILKKKGLQFIEFKDQLIGKVKVETIWTLGVTEKQIVESLGKSLVQLIKMENMLAKGKPIDKMM